MNVVCVCESVCVCVSVGVGLMGVSDFEFIYCGRIVCVYVCV